MKKEVYPATSEEETLGSSGDSTENPVLLSEDSQDEEEDLTFHDAESYLVNWEEHGSLIDYNSKDYTGVYLVAGKEGRGPTQKNNTVIRAQATGPVPDKHSYKRFEAQKILIQNGDQFGQPQYRPIDTGSAMNFISERFLDKWFPKTTRIEKGAAHGGIGGIVPNSKCKSTHGAVLKLYLPMESGEDVMIEGFFHIIESLKPGILLGMETIHPYKFEFDIPGGCYWLNSAGKRQGKLLCTRNLRQFQRPVRVAENVNIRPGTHQHIPVKFDAFGDVDMYFTGKTFLNSSFGEYGKAAHHVVSKDTTAVRFGNLGKTPISLKKGTVCGFVERVDDDEVMVMMGNSSTTDLITSWPKAEAPSSLLQRIPNPWRSKSWVKARASLRNTAVESDF